MGILLSSVHRLASLPSKDPSFPLVVQPVDSHLPHMILSALELNLRKFVEEEPPPFDTLVSACYKKVANHIRLV